LGAIAGGILIALSTSLNYFIYGRSEGIRGIVTDAFKTRRRDPEFKWKMSFLFGLVTLPFLTFMGYFDSG
jgi:hypothetical protein